MDHVVSNGETITKHCCCTGATQGQLNGKREKKQWWPGETKTCNNMEFGWNVTNLLCSMLIPTIISFINFQKQVCLSGPVSKRRNTANVAECYAPVRCYGVMTGTHAEIPIATAPWQGAILRSADHKSNLWSFVNLEHLIAWCWREMQ